MFAIIDGGTTNTRICLMEQGRIIGKKKYYVGIRDTLNGNNSYRDFIRSILNDISETHDAHPEAVLASGMLTSETGLYCCPHRTLPIDFTELALSLIPTRLPDISPLPFWFIPGLKTFGSSLLSAKNLDADTLSGMDILRGEESEIVGICTEMSLTDDFMMILPGSHTKYISIESGSRITSFRTSMTGELMRAVMENTILKSSLGSIYPERICEDYLHFGYTHAERYGSADAMFKVRILDKFSDGIKPEQLYSFLLGAVLCDDIVQIAKCGTPVYIGGSDPFRSAFRSLLEKSVLTGHVNEIPAEISDCAAAYGAEWLYRRHINEIFTEHL